MLVLSSFLSCDARNVKYLFFKSAQKVSIYRYLDYFFKEIFKAFKEFFKDFFKEIFKAPRNSLKKSLKLRGIL